MHGLANDFVIIDQRHKRVKISKKTIKNISDRKTGIGCDQLIIITKSLKKEVDCRIMIFNSNGDIAEACGNGSRCVAKILLKELKRKNIKIETDGGIICAKLKKDGNISINMGSFSNNLQRIPLKKFIKIKNKKSSILGTIVNVGNPHIVFLHNNLKKIQLKKIGPIIENHKIFPKKTNVEFIKIKSKNTINMRVWERGVGETFACGTGACASVYAGFKLGMLNRNVRVMFDDGFLKINIKKNDDIIMTGPAKLSFVGSLII